MKKKIILMLMTGMMVGSLCACGKQNTEVADITESVVGQDISEETEEPVQEEMIQEEMIQEETNEEEEQVPAEEETTVQEKPEETVQEEVQEETGSESTTEDNLPGPDVVELVNQRGDTTIGYKLVDGTYMDRIEKIYVFDGVDTWTDEDGVEWNEVVK